MRPAILQAVNQGNGLPILSNSSSFFLTVLQQVSHRGIALRPLDQGFRKEAADWWTAAGRLHIPCALQLIASTVQKHEVSVA
jgi:hypothetical protein